LELIGNIAPRRNRAVPVWFCYGIGTGEKT
jgi:hypothetical protein